MAVNINRLIINNGSITGHSHPDTRAFNWGDGPNVYKSYTISGKLCYNDQIDALYEYDENKSGGMPEDPSKIIPNVSNLNEIEFGDLITEIDSSCGGGRMGGSVYPIFQNIPFHVSRLRFPGCLSEINYEDLDDLYNKDENLSVIEITRSDTSLEEASFRSWYNRSLDVYFLDRTVEDISNMIGYPWSLSNPQPDYKGVKMVGQS